MPQYPAPLVIDRIDDHGLTKTGFRS